MIELAQAFRIGSNERIAVVGAGGKSTLVFQLAHQFKSPVLAAATTHLSKAQLEYADRHIQLDEKVSTETGIGPILPGITLFTGCSATDGRQTGLTMEQVEIIRQTSDIMHLPVIIEADGSRMLPLKAPGMNEPPIPQWVSLVIIVAGMSGLGKPLAEGFIHRPEVFSRLSGIAPGSPVTMEGLCRMLVHPEGGLKNIPPQARKIVLFNQADSDEQQERVRQAADSLLGVYHGVVCASLNPARCPGRPESLAPEIHAVYESCAAILLAGGGSKRMGSPKQVLTYQNEPFVRGIARKALAAGYSPVILVSGANAELIEAAVADLPVRTVRNLNWATGQSTSIRLGLSQVSSRCGAALFLLADQPQVPEDLLKQLRAQHAMGMPQILAPFVHGKRANPVLFDRSVFAAFDSLRGDEGGRKLFTQIPVDALDWPDESLLLDVDTNQDYQTLIRMTK
jgi:molybdenum cofactor cytidylyltransferase